MITVRRSYLAFGAAIVLGVAGTAIWWTGRDFGSSVPLGAKADRIVVEKAAHRMRLLAGETVLATYDVAIGSGSPGPKQREGDRRTPEGHYRITFHNARSGWHLSLRTSYPEADDVARAAAAGVPPGSDIMIHGIRWGLGWIGSWHRLADWTNGCIAVTNSEMDEIWRVVDDGTPIDILP
ncbi:L,D-transpeptidase family protein [Oryzibacter oryziterrae]|uniref:L,D-transpeptidase family protein n=1 Tax=Oryzibacter oryziterrae TaxID=2766474 RepID=UPI001F02C5F0|nr:L,D-transpeptidase family protein [Oryzibacter oryziterrae]